MFFWVGNQLSRLRTTPHFAAVSPQKQNIMDGPPPGPPLWATAPPGGLLASTTGSTDLVRHLTPQTAALAEDLAALAAAGGAAADGAPAGAPLALVLKKVRLCWCVCA